MAASLPASASTSPLGSAVRHPGSSTGAVVSSAKSLPELFSLAIGGYGLFGFIYSATLRLVPRRKLERVVELRAVDSLMEAFAGRIQVASSMAVRHANLHASGNVYDNGDRVCTAANGRAW